MPQKLVKRILQVFIGVFVVLHLTVKMLMSATDAV
jgi:hypothetical protein